WFVCSSRRRHTRLVSDWSSDVCSSDLYLRLLKLPEDIQKMLEDELISMGHARALLGLDTKDQIRKLANQVVEKKLSVRQTEQAVQALKRAPAKSPPKENSETTNKRTNNPTARVKGE